MNNGFESNQNQQPYDPNMNQQAFNPNQQGYMPNYNQPYQQGYDQPYQQGYDQPYQQGYGQPIVENNIYAQPGEGNGDNKALVSLILGIVSLLTCCCYGVPSIILGIASIVLAIMAKKDNMGKMPGMAIGGMICGIIGILLGLAYLFLLILGIMGGALDSGYYY